MKLPGGQTALQNLARRRADHPAKRPGKVSGVGESGGVGRVGDGLAERQLAGPALQAQPEDVRAKWNTDGCREQMQESGWRQTDACGDCI